MTEIKIQSEYDYLDKYEYNNGIIYYFKKDTGILHNPYGPAALFKNGTKEYWIDDKLHRLDGPAKILSNGVEYYYINGVCLSNSKQDFFKNIKKN